MTFGATPAQILDSGNPSNVADGMSAAKLGTGLKLVPRTLRAAVSSNVIVLPEAVKAIIVLQAFASAGTTIGYKTPVLTGASLSSGQVKANSTGDIEFESSDAVSEAEVVYLMAEQGGIFEESIPVTANVGTLLQGREGVILLSAQITAPSGIGSGLVKTRAASVTDTTRFCCLNGPGTGVIFAATDSATQATVRYIAKPDVGAGVVDTFANRLDTVVAGTPTV